MTTLPSVLRRLAALLAVLLAVLLGGQPALAVVCCPDGEPAAAAAFALETAPETEAEAAAPAADADSCCACVGACAGGCSHGPATGLQARAPHPAAPLRIAAADLRGAPDVQGVSATPPGLKRPPRA